MSKTLQKWIDSRPDIVDELWIDSDGYWIYLKPHVIALASECSTIHGETVSSALADIKAGFMLKSEYFVGE